MIATAAAVTIEAAQLARSPPQAATGETTQAADPLLKAEILIAHKGNADARAILLDLEKRRSGERARDNQVEFLLGLLDMADSDYNSAIARFRRILVSEPKNVRVRLEMGRAYFLSGDYYDAERQFRFAGAGRLPPNVLANVDRFLAAIRSLKTFSYSFSLAVAPDSNLNAGPATDSVTLYGLPFQLSPTARANSGVGLAMDASAEWAPRIAKHVKIRTGAVLQRSQYEQTAFDDMTLLAYVGPRLTLKRWDADLTGTVARRWYGDRIYSNTAGIGADATYFLSTRMGMTAGVNLGRIDYPAIDDQSGTLRSFSLNLFYTPTTASIVRLIVAAGKVDAHVTAFSNRSRVVGLSYSRELKGGITFGIAPSITHIAYEAPLAAFNKIRVDEQDAAQITLLDRRIDLGGFTPRVMYTFIHNGSSIPLYRFNRSRFEFGLTRAF